ncbi:hypothetical protein [Nocardioides daphniae]|uniref:Uncharacterized protein n=1 Tax=Nocardioides daphniae TaxID=402297 RepID=A0A4P7UB07_9ACTN|nr:hypothetical protein [Nocardioides daphniae]QCC76099.1 hypothetical protein E2C04_00805 [Nocardioides daphniae]GGD10173.1 hypothetical protein GCM10007231_06250 [Nocardioides daphniae]
MSVTPMRTRRLAAGSIAAAFALSGLAAVSTAPAHAAAFDPSCSPPDPAIKTLKISPTQVNVKTGKRTVVVSGTTTGPALDSVYVTADPVGKGVDQFAVGNPKGNSFSVKVVVPKGAGNGKHQIELSLSSEDGYAWYSPADLAAKSLPNSFNVISKPDLVKPTIKKIKLNTKKVNTTRKAAKVQVTATLADKGGSGLDYAYVQLSNGPGNAAAVLKKKRGKWVGTALFPKWAGNKKATVTTASVRDVAGNSTSYGKFPGAKKLTKALKPSFKVVSKSDRKAPSIGSVTVTPNAVKVGERRWQVTYSIKASDTQSGVVSVYPRLVLRGGDYPATTGYSFLTLKKGVWTGKATIWCFDQAGTYDVEIESQDRVGNKSVTRKGTVTLSE